MKLVAGTVLLGLALVACSGSEEDAGKQPAAVTVPERTKDSTEPEQAVSAGGTDTPLPATEPGPVASEPAPAAPVPAGPETCETLAAKKATPAGKLTDVVAVNGSFGITPVDVYANEDAEGRLQIVLTETANACGYHSNALRAKNLNELTLEFPKGAAELGPKALEVSGFVHEAGTVCFAGDDFAEIGSAWAGGSATGKLTITSKTATSVEGSVDITMNDGSKTTFAFRAPICAKADVAAELTCCAE